MIQATIAPKMSYRGLWPLVVTYAGVLSLFSIVQLVSFEYVIGCMSGMLGVTGSVAAGSIIVATGLSIFSLPYLLRLTLSPLARWCSRVCVILAPLWLGGLGAAGIMRAAEPLQAIALAAGAAVFLTLAAVSLWALRAPSRS